MMDGKSILAYRDNSLFEEKEKKTPTCFSQSFIYKRDLSVNK